MPTTALTYIAPIIAMACAAFAFHRYRKLGEIKAQYTASMTTFAPVTKAQAQLDATAAQYHSLQQDYQKDKARLHSLEKVVSQYNIGVGSTDSSAYISSSENDDLSNLKTLLAQTKAAADSLVKNKDACICGLQGDFVVNGSKAKAKTLVNREIKLRLRCFDNEVDAAINLADWNNINRLVDRLKRSFDEINQRGETMKVKLQPAYLRLRITELKLSYEIARLETDIKEQEREDKRVAAEAEREEARIKKAAENATKARERMEKLIEQEFAKLKGASEQQQALYDMHKQELEELKQREKRALSMAQTTRAGYVYVLSNETSFGQNVVKIGMTRRVDPNERVRELGDASVPDLFQVHGFFYSDDAPAMESALHKQFADQRVNLVNKRKEFFMASPEEVISAIEQGGFKMQKTG